LRGFREAFGFGKIAEHSKTLDLHKGNLRHALEGGKKSGRKLFSNLVTGCSSEPSRGFAKVFAE
jgi:hypothetical protein